MIICRIRTKARMIDIFTCTATSERNTPLSIAIPSWVKAKGSEREPPQLEVPIWHLKLVNSSPVSVNMKSGGKRAMFRLTALFRIFVSVWYNSAKSKSSITL